MTTVTITDRIADWSAIFPPKYDDVPNVEAEWLALLEAALHHLRATGRPIRSDSARAYVITYVTGLLNALGFIDTEAAR